MHDSLTQLANRLAVIEHLDTRLSDTNAETERALGGFALLHVGLDSFKKVNDSLGHDAGDALLKIVALRINETTRDTDFVARLGGDEFLIVLPQISNDETATLVANKLASRLAESYTVNGSRATVTASIGVSLFPKDGVTRETLMKCAYIAMHVAKEAGQNQVRFYGPASAA